MVKDEFIGKPMMVMQVRPEFSIQYKASPKIQFKTEHLENKKALLEFLSKKTKHWKEGDYFLRSHIGPFAGFFVKKGGRVTLHKENQNRVPYICWSLIAKRK